MKSNFWGLSIIKCSKLSYLHYIFNIVSILAPNSIVVDTFYGNTKLESFKLTLKN